MRLLKLACVCALVALFFPLQVAAYSYQGPEAELIALINAERGKNNIPLLAFNQEVARLARYKSEEMKRHGMLCHQSLVYGSPEQMLSRFAVPQATVGANIAMGQESSREVMEAWANSKYHYANMMNAEFTGAGVGLGVDDNGIYYWTLILVGE